jgi:hypothetical protein
LDNKGIQATVLVVVIVSGAYVGFIYTGLLGPNGPTNDSQITSIEILANSTDILCPELMQATLTPQSSGTWQVAASFVNDSLGPYNLTVYDKTFIADTNEVEGIKDALYDGLNLTHSSNDSIEDALNNTNIAFSILISYKDGTWIYVCALLNAKCHIILDEGQGTLNKGVLAGRVMESWAVLDEFIHAVNQVFTNHLG